jgi:hypothetical protein
VSDSVTDGPDSREALASKNLAVAVAAALQTEALIDSVPE